MRNSILKYVYVLAIRTDNRIQNRKGKERREESRQNGGKCMLGKVCTGWIEIHGPPTQSVSSLCHMIPCASHVTHPTEVVVDQTESTGLTL